MDAREFREKKLNKKKMDEILTWLYGSDWHYDMYSCDPELIKEFGVVNTDKYWTYTMMYKVVTRKSTRTERDCFLEMLKYVRDSDWALSIQDYYYDLEDQFGIHTAKTFSVNAIIASIE